jgi:integrase
VARHTRDSDPRARCATANRILTVLKAALNHAYHDGKVPSDEAWRRAKPFRNVDSPKIGYLSVAEATRLVNACEPAFRPLVQAALLTGCRYGELIKMACHDFNPDAGCVTVRESKSGKPRHVPLTEEGQRFFERVTAGRPGSEVMFLRADGNPWGMSHQQRPLNRACEIAGLDPAVSFHVLRHTYGSLLAMRGVPLQVIAEALGHADTRITSRHYAHLMPSYVADTIRKHLPNFGVERDNITPLRIAP